MDKVTKAEAFTSKDTKELVWKGLPFRGQIPHIKKDDPEHMLPVLDWDVYVEIFDMLVPDQKAKYIEVCNKAVRGHAKCFVEKYLDVKDTVKIYLKWGEPYYRNRTKAEKSGMMQ